jgi:hypothetical protein
MKLTPLIFALLFVAGGADSSRERSPIHSQIGKNCIVSFRRDALGMAADSPASVTTGGLNGAAVTQMGELMEVGADWIVIDYHGRVFHIPQEAILMVEFGNNISSRHGLSEILAPPADHTHGDHVHSATGDHSHSVPAERAQ